MKFLVTGSAGLIGTQVVNDLINQNYTVYSCYNNSKPKNGLLTKLDLINTKDIEDTLNQIKPEIIIHLAATTDVDLCEKEQNHTMKINAQATETLAKQSAKLGAFFLYVSTDYVFDGTEGFRKENDIPNPLGFYGKSKFKGETVLSDINTSYAIARTSTPFGIHSTKKSFPIWIKENLEQKNEIPVLIDQFTSPTYTLNLSKMLIEIVTRQLTGIIHLSGSTRISRFDFANLIAEYLNLDKTMLKPTKIADMTWIAPRPMDSSLDVSYATKILSEKPQTIQQSLELFLSQI